MAIDVATMQRAAKAILMPTRAGANLNMLSKRRLRANMEIGAPYHVIPNQISSGGVCVLVVMLAMTLCCAGQSKIPQPGR